VYLLAHRPLLFQGGEGLAELIVEGLKELLGKIDKLPDAYLKAIGGVMDNELRKTVNHIKVEYSRPNTGKGFTDQTGNLRNSLAHKIETMFKEVNGWVYAGMDYAERVELQFTGRYAFLWPGVQDREDEILQAIVKAMKSVAHFL